MKKTPTYATRGRPVTEPLTLLVRGRELLADGNTWCRHHLGKGLKRVGRPSTYCATGALYEAANIRWEYEGSGAYRPVEGSFVVRDARNYLAEASSAMHDTYITDFNDERAKSVKDVLAVYDRAIELAKQDKKAKRKVSA